MSEEITNGGSASYNRTRNLTLIGLMTAVLCILGPFSIPIPVSPVPLSLTNFAVYITVYTLGMKSGTLSVLVYLCLGTAGLPVFSGFSGGLGKLAGPYRGISHWFSLSRTDPGFLYGTHTRAKTLFHPRNDYRSCSMLHLRHSMACRTDESLLFRSTQRRASSPIFPEISSQIIAAAIIGPKLLTTVKKNLITVCKRGLTPLHTVVRLF